jgi:hypothetical protein
VAGRTPQPGRTPCRQREIAGRQAFQCNSTASSFRASAILPSIAPLQIIMKRFRRWKLAAECILAPAVGSLSTAEHNVHRGEKMRHFESCCTSGGVPIIGYERDHHVDHLWASPPPPNDRHPAWRPTFLARVDRLQSSQRHRRPRRGGPNHARFIGTICSLSGVCSGARHLGGRSALGSPELASVQSGKYV